MEYPMITKLQLRFDMTGSGARVKTKTALFSYVNESASDEALQAVANSLATLYAYPMIDAVRTNAVTLPKQGAEA